MESHIQIKNLNAYYGSAQALKDINIEIPRKQITVIMANLRVAARPPWLKHSTASLN